MQRRPGGWVLFTTLTVSVQAWGFIIIMLSISRCSSQASHCCSRWNTGSPLHNKQWRRSWFIILRKVVYSSVVVRGLHLHDRKSKDNAGNCLFPGIQRTTFWSIHTHLLNDCSLLKDDLFHFHPKPLTIYTKHNAQSCWEVRIKLKDPTVALRQAWDLNL